MSAEYADLDDTDHFDDDSFLVSLGFIRPDGIEAFARLTDEVHETLVFVVNGVTVTDGPRFHALAKECYERRIAGSDFFPPVPPVEDWNYAKAVFECLLGYTL